MEEIFYYPRVQYSCTEESVNFKTNIRIKHTDGNWYVKQEESKFPNNSSKIIDYLNFFLLNCHIPFIMGVVVPDIKDSNGNDLFVLDTCQDDEVTRLTDTYLKKIIG